MPEMRFAPRAMDFRPLDEHAPVAPRANVLLGDGRPKTGPASAGIELGIGTEKRIAATDAAKKSRGVHLIIRPRKCSVGTLLPGDVILFRAQQLPPLGFAANHFRD